MAAGWNKGIKTGPPSEETKRKQSESHKGKRLSEETKQKQRVASTGKGNGMYGRTGELHPLYGKIGEDAPMFGKHHSKTSKLKIGTGVVSTLIAEPERWHGKHKSGWYVSKKNNSKLFYRSSYELLAFEILEQQTNVKHYETCKFSIDYQQSDGSLHKYIPDLLVTYAGGEKQIIEVKAEWQLADEIVKAKADAASKRFDYLIWTEKHLKKEARHRE